MNYRQFYRQFFHPHIWLYLLGILLLIAVDVLQLWVPRLIGIAIDDLIAGKEHLTLYIGYILGLGIAILFCKYGYRYFLLGEMRKAEYSLRKALVTRAIHLPIYFYEKNGPGKIMALLINDVTSIRVAMGLGMMLLIDAVFLNVVALLMMTEQISFRMSLWILLPMPVILCVAIGLGRILRVRFRYAQELFSTMTEFTQELFMGWRVIKGLSEEESTARQFARINRINREGNLRLARAQAFYLPLTRTLSMICFAISIYLCGQMVYQQQITIGDFVAINGYIGILIGATMGIGGMIGLMNRALGSYDRIRAFFDEPLEEISASSESCRQGENISVRIQHLTFTYPQTEAPALQDVSMHIPAGKHIGIAGPPGAGKSTLVKLLLRLYPISRNMIYINEKDICDWDIPVLRTISAYVPQEPVLFSRTVAENIAFPAASGNYSAAQVEAVSVAADISISLQQRLHGHAGKLKEAGTDLSGGQRQRIGIARALYRDAPLVLMDDVFSALDYQTAASIERHFTKALQGKTVVLISQRMAALRKADYIYVLLDGKIAEEGTHDELWQKKGVYFELYHKQEERSE